MKYVYPYVTNDGSVGLYNAEFGDIYHSVTGALSEAFDKFTNNSDLNYYFDNNTEINVLDICYGIGYNTKSLLQNFFEILNKNNFKKYYSDAIYSDNISGKKINIEAVDLDEKLILISPLLKIYKNFDLKSQKLPDKKIEKYLADNVQSKYKYQDFIDILILEKIFENNYEKYKDILKNIKSDIFSPFLDPDKMAYMSSLLSECYTDTFGNVQEPFVHNIYYRNISSSNKYGLKALCGRYFDFTYKISDARNYLRYSNKLYDLILLDAFSPNKCPCLWSYDFFKILFSHLKPNGRLLTYSNSATVRNAMLMANFFVGKIFNSSENKFTGTIAVKNSNFIKYELSELDLSLIKSKAGIVYRDETLSASNEAIIEDRNYRLKNSNLLSSSFVLKRHRGEYDYV